MPMTNVKNTHVSHPCLCGAYARREKVRRALSCMMGILYNIIVYRDHCAASVIFIWDCECASELRSLMQTDYGGSYLGTVRCFLHFRMLFWVTYICITHSLPITDGIGVFVLSLVIFCSAPGNTKSGSVANGSARR